jgi:hypothetical protein
LETPWDPLHRAYFSGYAMWTYLNTPFLMALPGFEVEEVAPWREGEKTWRVLRTRFPAAIPSHCPTQEFTSDPTSCCVDTTIRSMCPAASQRLNTRTISQSSMASGSRRNVALTRVAPVVFRTEIEPTFGST